ncbi:MAG: SufE family protein [Proteobacteria bacterium]|nr:SufE family protein [Pseudomonadota bacterium]
MGDLLPFSEIKDTFLFLEDWEARYAFLIDLGRKLRPYPEERRDDAHKVPGCTSQVWMAHSWQGDRLTIITDSDAHLVKGLLAILVALYSGKTADEIKAVPVEAAFAELGLEGHLSPNRRNGFFAVASRIEALAAAHT